MANQEKELEKKVKNYVSTEGVTTKQLEVGLWYVEHKRQLKLVLTGFLILISAVSWAFTIYGFAYYLARGMNEDEILTKQLVQVNGADHNYIKQIAAKNLVISPVEIISTDRKYDLYARLENDNQRWWVELDYYFVASGRPTEKTRGYILPSQTRYLTALAQDFAYYPEDVRLVIENISWHRINQHEIADWPAYRDSHLNIESTNIKFVPANVSPLSEKLALNQLSFKAINHTAYNYWSVGFVILLYSGDRLTGINHYVLNDFMSGQERPVEISWSGNLGQVARIEIIPEVNIMRNDIYIRYEGGVGEEK